MTNNITINRDEFPSLYLTASALSVGSQKTYILLNLVQYVSLILGALLSSISVSDISYKFLLAALGVTSLIISTAVTVAIQLIKKEKDWYGGRAIAESVKTTCWRFIMRAEPYKDESEINVEKKFMEDLTVIKNEKRFLAGALASELNIRPQITDKMKKIRTLSVNERLTIYLDRTGICILRLA